MYKCGLHVQRYTVLAVGVSMVNEGGEEWCVVSRRVVGELEVRSACGWGLDGAKKMREVTCEEWEVRTTCGLARASNWWTVGMVMGREGTKLRKRPCSFGCKGEWAVKWLWCGCGVVAKGGCMAMWWWCMIEHKQTQNWVYNNTKNQQLCKMTNTKETQKLTVWQNKQPVTKMATTMIQKLVCGVIRSGLHGASKNSLFVHHQYDKNVDHRTNNTTQSDEDKMNTYTNLYLLLVDSAVHCKLK